MKRIKRQNSNIESIVNLVKTPCYICEETLLKQNLKHLQCIQKETGIEILLAIKAFAFSDMMPMVNSYLSGFCASGLYESKHCHEFSDKNIHTYSPAFKDEEINDLNTISSHIIFNSFNQFDRFRHQLLSSKSIGLRVNPEVSFSPVDIYNPCTMFSRFGLTKKSSI